MKLYVCYGTWTAGKPVHAHPCGEAHKALAQAGHQPEVVRSYGLGAAAGHHQRPHAGRREVKELTGNYWVPVLVTDDGAVDPGLADRSSTGRRPTRRPGRAAACYLPLPRNDRGA